MADVTFIDHSREAIEAMQEAVNAALDAMGLQAVSHAKNNLTAAGRVNTGNLRNSISHAVHEGVAYIGTNINYALYVEMGTGVYIAGGRKSPWAFQDADGNWHFTRGIPPSHFLKNAAADHVDEYKSIAETVIKAHQP